MKLIRYIIILSGLAFTSLALTGQFKHTFKPLNSGPIQTFEKNCARCHGPHGTFYGSGFGSREHKDLRKIVEEMMRGPAFLQPSEADVEAMTAYHHALSLGEPFICITRYDSTNQILYGEVMLQDRFIAELQNGNSLKIAVDSAGNWHTELTSSLLLVATNDSSGTKLNPRKHQWSHQK